MPETGQGVQSTFRQDVRVALRETVPVAMGYLPLGSAYGLLFASSGLQWWWAPVCSVLIFAGAMQFLSVGLLSTHTSLTAIFITTFIVNFRHVFYGLSYPMSRVRRRPARVYGMWALTDETYSLLAGRADDPALTSRRITLIQLFSHGYWVLGGVIGAVGAMALPNSIAGIDFSLTALFVVLAYEHVSKPENKGAVAMGLAASAVALAIGRSQFLSVAMATFLGLVLISYLRQNRKMSDGPELRSPGDSGDGGDYLPASGGAVPGPAEGRSGAPGALPRPGDACRGHGDPGLLQPEHG
ncbi:AzlC family ABC transporter permease [Actinoplanes sp. NPDC026623]|uniref:AzlC family ABC transporter permease n=1 Tax=Actinoplanes sp. NPDC026623 TaxID=3155610 RepID=UPI0033D232EB